MSSVLKFSRTNTIKAIKARQHCLQNPVRAPGYVANNSLKSSASSACSVKSVCSKAGSKGSLKSTGDSDPSGKSGEANIEPSDSGNDSPSDSNNKQSKSLYFENSSNWILSGPESAALNVAMYFMARRRVVIFVNFSLTTEVCGAGICGMTLRSASKAILISLILLRSLAFAVFLLYLLNGAGFCLDLCDLLGFVRSVSVSGVESSAVRRTDRGRNEYLSEVVAPYSPLLFASVNGSARRSEIPSNCNSESIFGHNRDKLHVSGFSV